MGIMFTPQQIKGLIRRFDAKFRAPVRLLLDEVQAAGVELPPSLHPLPPAIGNSRQLSLLAAELEYYAAKADALKRS